MARAKQEKVVRQRLIKEEDVPDHEYTKLYGWKYKRRTYEITLTCGHTFTLPPHEFAESVDYKWKTMACPECKKARSKSGLV